MKVIVLPPGSVIADSWTPLFTVSIAPETKPLPFSACSDRVSRPGRRQRAQRLWSTLA
jgi:hypothetical protein